MSSEPITLEINGLRHRVFVSGEGRPVLLLHGWPDSALLWRDVIPHLTNKGYRTIAPDLRGFGETDAPAGTKNYKVAHIADDCLKILDALNVREPVDVMGHDWGSVMGWYLTLLHKERVNSLVAYSVGHPNAFTRAGLGQIAHSWYMLLYEMRFVAEWLFRANGYWLTRKVANYPPETETWIRDLSRDGRLSAGMNWYRANLFDILTGKMPTPNASIPVLGIIGKQDIGLTVEQMENSVNYCDAGFRFKSIDGGHWLPVDSPKEVSKLILGFIDNK
jgi:pimeloyl-ACP methyl ester carboxylesterase